MIIIKVRNYLSIITFVMINLVSSQENKLFWDGNDWNTIAKNLNHNQNLIFSVKKAYLTGVLDGRLYGYLKTWNKNKDIADDVFSETVDYLTYSELIRNIDSFYKDPVNNYIPLPSAVIISNMYAERVPMQNIDSYIKDTKDWINKLTLELEILNYSKLLENKTLKHSEKYLNQYE